MKAERWYLTWLVALPGMLLTAPAPVAWAEEAANGASADGAAPAVAAEAEGKPADAANGDETDFVRFVPDKNGGATLEAAVVTYENKAGQKVSLISAFHVGEKSYYEALEKSFPSYDALLYEMVKPKGAPAPRKGAQGGGGAVSGFQRALKDLLELEFQLDAIDYTPANFVHADMDYETFASLQSERGESIFTLMLRSMLNEANRQQQGKGAPPITIFHLLAAMTAEDSARQYKLLLGRQFQDIEAQVAGMEGPNGSVILTERNKAALKVLKEQLEAGKQNIGLFYGAAHMHGIEEALVKEMGFTRGETEWLVAWDMTVKEGEKKPKKDPAPAQPAPATEE